MNRPFNKSSYDAHDMRNKNKLIEIMSRKGYSIVGDVDQEHFKKYDLLFRHNVFSNEISFENETRPVFDKIKNVFNTIHIPIRKKNTQADYYVVWNPDMTEMALIDRDTIIKHRKAPVEVNCKESHVNYEYTEEFIDIPKSEATFLKEEQGRWMKQKL